MAKWKKSCCNPFDKYRLCVRDKHRLRTVTKSLCDKFPSIVHVPIVVIKLKHTMNEHSPRLVGFNKRL